MNTPAEAPSPLEAVGAPTAELGAQQQTSMVAGALADGAHLKEITKQLAEDMGPIVGRLRAAPGLARPLLERARPMADVMLPIVDEMRPLYDDLRPVAQDFQAIFAELVLRANALAARLDQGPLRSVVRTLGTGARHLASIRPSPRVAVPSLSLPEAIRVPHASAARVPSLHLPFASAARAIFRLLRPGRGMFRVVAVGIIVVVLSNAPLREAMVAELDWTRTALQSVEIPTLQLPAVELPTIELPTIELPTIELPTFQLPEFTVPNFEMPTFQLPGQEPVATSKLAPAQFELPPLNAYRASFETQASYPTVPANATVEWVVALRNTGSVGWYRGVAGAQASLALTDGTAVAVQTTDYVAPGQVGWFIARFRAPAGPGPHTVALFPRIDGRGELPDLGIFTVVTVR